MAAWAEENGYEGLWIADSGDMDALTVAVLMGHADPSTLAKVYQHLAHNPQHLLEQARKAVG